MLRGWEFQLKIDVNSKKAVYLQIADALIKDIQIGRLKPGDALPGSRNLAQVLKVNRNTVVEALNVLTIEGWLVSKERQGTFVADVLPAFEEMPIRNHSIATVKRTDNKHYRIQFDDGYPDSKIAPITELARAYRQIFNLKGRWQMMGYGNELGDVIFRKEIAHMLNLQRGMQVNEHNLCITRGSQMAMYLTAQCLFESGDNVIIENPGYKPAWKAFKESGAKLLPVNVDKDGLLIEEVHGWLRSGKKIKAIYVTPHHQYPTTVTLSLKRRLELIKLSNEYGFTIIEDDYDNEFHFGYRPVLPLSSYTELKNYVYIGTMSKVVAPALRIGYLACNNTYLMQKISSLRKIIDVQGDNIMEQAVLQLIKEGVLKRHIKKATHYYKAKRDLTETLLQKHIQNKAFYIIPDGGLAFWIVPKKQVEWVQVSHKLKEMGIKIITPDAYSFKGFANGLRFGYGSLLENELEVGIIALASLI